MWFGDTVDLLSSTGIFYTAQFVALRHSGDRQTSLRLCNYKPRRYCLIGCYPPLIITSLLLTTFSLPARLASLLSLSICRMLATSCSF